MYVRRNQFNYKFSFLFKVEFTNDKQEKCRVVFDQMEEHTWDRYTRRVRRKVVDSSLPDVSP